ncbi:lysozyme [Roseovarius sp. SYSU LYC5161]|uniref:lysozyme n=1 Tax=Roseovarius halophilus (ex Wu et al. 2025) TaxID=3376060 RepID=UPI003999F902
MKTSDKGILEIAAHEGIVPAPYRDSVGTWTYGIGHTAAAGSPDPQEMNGAMPENVDAALARCIRIFRDDLKQYEERVSDAISVPLAQHEFDALVSFDFNTCGIYRAELTKALNRGHPDAARHFMGWLKPPEIRKRRMAEMRLFETGQYGTSGELIAVWKTDNAGRLDGILDRVTGTELLAIIRHSNVRDEPAHSGWLARIIKMIFGMIERWKK